MSARTIERILAALVLLGLFAALLALAWWGEVVGGWRW